MVKSELENKQGYKAIQINAWKYEKEALARVFLRQIKQKFYNFISNPNEIGVAYEIKI